VPEDIPKPPCLSRVSGRNGGQFTEGLNLMDEFSDNICAYVEPFDGDLKLVSVETLP